MRETGLNPDSMARIDRYVEFLLLRNADALVIPPGARAMLVTRGEERPVTAQALAEKDVEEMLAEIAPPELASDLAQEGEHAFEHVSPHGRALIGVRRDGRGLRIQLTPGAGVAEPEPAPAVEARGEDSIDGLLREMVREGCSDLHLTSGSPPLCRKDGMLQPLAGSDSIGVDALREMLFAIAPSEKREEFEARNDSDFAYEIADVARFRCNLFRDRTGIGAVFRVIPSKIPSAEDLGLSAEILELCKLKKGLVVVTGPTGSGKSTTLAAMIDYANRNRADHIITIEDPIEFVHENRRCLVNQREIGNHTQGFKSALRAALREDPDIVLIGEMRDLETVEIAIETAETGHLVFGTLHTNTAPSTVDRIIDQFPTDRQGQVRTMLAGSLRGVIAQTLCRKRGGGRCAALEVLIVNHAVSNLIREGKTFQIPSIMQTGRKLGMRRMNDALLDLVIGEVLEPEEAHANAVDREEFATLLSSRGFPLPANEGEREERSVPAGAAPTHTNRR